jgi:spermidine/putrescine transport system substrate-binding protein
MSYGNSQISRPNPSRRRFLKLSTAALTGVTLANCAGSITQNQPTAANSPTPASTSDTKTLYIYTWGDYNNPDLYKRFTDQTGIDVISDVYDSNEVMLAKLQAGGGNQYSIIYPSDYMITQMVEAKLLRPLDASRLKGVENFPIAGKIPPTIRIMPTQFLSTGARRALSTTPKSLMTPPQTGISFGTITRPCPAR